MEGARRIVEDAIRWPPSSANCRPERALRNVFHRRASALHHVEQLHRRAERKGS
jgi:hypothetical protein